ncbi:MAG: hypothetical protein ACFB10_16655 [Salibacteraceae bacterium]
MLEQAPVIFNTAMAYLRKMDDLHYELAIAVNLPAGKDLTALAPYSADGILYLKYELIDTPDQPQDWVFQKCYALTKAPNDQYIDVEVLASGGKGSTVNHVAYTDADER